MTVDTKTVANRRELRYESYDELLADAETLAAQGHQVIGNWSFAQILEHLGIALEGSIDGIPFKAPWMMRTGAKLLMKKKLLTQPLSPGFQIPDSAKPVVYPQEDKSLEEALDHLRRAVQRLKSEPATASHPLFDNLSPSEWDQWNFRHAEMHMSFVLPVSG